MVLHTMVIQVIHPAATPGDGASVAGPGSLGASRRPWGILAGKPPAVKSQLWRCT